METPPPLAAGCRRCAALVRSRSQIVHGYGDPHPTVVFVGTAPELPGADASGVPLVSGVGGERFQALLMAMGLSEERTPNVERPRLLGAYLTYLVRCLPPRRLPDQREIAHCAPYLWQELAQLAPQVIVALGPVPSQVLYARLVGGQQLDLPESHAQVYVTDTGSYLVTSLAPEAMRGEDARLFLRVMRELLGQHPAPLTTNGNGHQPASLIRPLRILQAAQEDDELHNAPSISPGG